MANAKKRRMDTETFPPDLLSGRRIYEPDAEASDYAWTVHSACDLKLRRLSKLDSLSQ